MHLHEIYEMLMRRGMPKHRDLVWTAFAEPCVACALNGDVAILTTNTARDLITMHALRWWMTMRSKNSMWIGQKQIHARQVRTGNRKVGISYVDEVNGGPWILAAILAATEHLEPKGDDDAKHP